MDIEKVRKYSNEGIDIDEEGNECECQEKLFFIEVTFGGDKCCFSEIIDSFYHGMESGNFDFSKMLSVVECGCYWIEKDEYSGEDVVAFDTEGYSSTACLDWVFEDRKSAEEQVAKIGYDFFKRGFEYFSKQILDVDSKKLWDMGI
jgi:hypothetical protein